MKASTSLTLFPGSLHLAWRPPLLMSQNQEGNPIAGMYHCLPCKHLWWLGACNKYFCMVTTDMISLSPVWQ